MAFASDAFTGLTAGTELNGRTADLGGTWAGTNGKLRGKASTGDAVENTTTGSFGGLSTVGTPAGTDYEVKGTIHSDNFYNSIALVVRYVATKNRHFFGYYSYGNGWRIYRWDDDDGNVRLDTDGSNTLTPNASSVEATLIVSGTQAGGNLALTLKSGTTIVATATYTTNTNYDGAGVPGIRAANIDGAGRSTIDDWSATDSGSPPAATANTLTLLGVGKNA